MTTIIAIVGWLLFLAVARLYWVGNRLNSQESNALALYSLAITLSDDFRSGVRAGVDQAIGKLGSAPQKTVMYGLIEGVTENAKSCYKPDSEISTIDIVTDALTK
jgi:hypothetical protein